jgi:hypothetical protein
MNQSWTTTVTITSGDICPALTLGFYGARQHPSLKEPVASRARPDYFSTRNLRPSPSELVKINLTSPEDRATVGTERERRARGQDRRRGDRSLSKSSSPSFLHLSPPSVLAPGDKSTVPFVRPLLLQLALSITQAPDGSRFVSTGPIAVVLVAVLPFRRDPNQDTHTLSGGVRPKQSREKLSRPKRIANRRRLLTAL